MTREIVEEAGKREYLYLKTYDKQVMALLIVNAKVMDEGRLEVTVTWKCGDVYEKILGEMQ